MMVRDDAMERVKRTWHISYIYYQNGGKVEIKIYITSYMALALTVGLTVPKRRKNKTH